MTVRQAAAAAAAATVRYRRAEIGCPRAEGRATLERISEPVGPDGPENWFHRRTLDDETFDAMMTAIESGE